MTILRAEKWKVTRDDMRIMVILLIFDFEAILSVRAKSMKKYVWNNRGSGIILGIFYVVIKLTVKNDVRLEWTQRSPIFHSHHRQRSPKILQLRNPHPLAHRPPPHALRSPQLILTFLHQLNLPRTGRHLPHLRGNHSPPPKDPLACFSSSLGNSRQRLLPTRPLRRSSVDQLLL